MTNGIQSVGLVERIKNILLESGFSEGNIEVRNDNPLANVGFLGSTIFVSPQSPSYQCYVISKDNKQVAVFERDNRSSLKERAYKQVNNMLIGRGFRVVEASENKAIYKK